MKDKVMNILNKVLKFIKDHKVVLILNVVIFALAVLIQSLYVYHIKGIVTYLLMLIYIIVPTILATKKFNIKSNEIFISIAEIYVLFIIFLGYCSNLELYGITDKSFGVPAFVDAIFVTLMFSCIEYIAIKIGSLKKVKKDDISRTK